MLIKPPEETGLYLIEPEELEKLEKFFVKVLKQKLKQRPKQRKLLTKLTRIRRLRGSRTKLKRLSLVDRP